MILMKGLRGKVAILTVVVPAATVALAYGIFRFNTTLTYQAGALNEQLANTTAAQEEVYKPIHLSTPEPLKAVYMTSCVAGTPSFRSELIKLIEETEINAVVIDVKDYSGTLSFEPVEPLLKDSLSTRCFAPDMKDLIRQLHDKNIYTIARITVFQDPFWAPRHTNIAVQRASDGALWQDRKGITYLDPASREVWDYIVAIGRESYNLGFDELNFDYIRFPSDGNMQDIHFPVFSTRGLSKAEQIKEFFSYLHEQLDSTGAVLSADLFGMTTTNADDLNIGQILEYAEPYFDYIAPMVYPSHYPPGFIGLQNPAAHPYEVIKYALDQGVSKLVAASSTPKKLRPWLQDFDLGATYTSEMVQAQIRATYDAGLTSWMLWDPANTYTRAALIRE